MIKMGMLGHGTRVNQTVKKFEAGTPYSVQANYVSWSSRIQTVGTGATSDFSFTNYYWKDSSAQDRNPMPYGGKILEVRIIHHKVNSDSMYFVALLNGVEQDALKVEIASNAIVDTEYKSTSGNEVEFTDSDFIGFRVKSVSGQIDFDDVTIFIVYGFNIGESTA